MKKATLTYASISTMACLIGPQVMKKATMTYASISTMACLIESSSNEEGNHDLC